MNTEKTEKLNEVIENLQAKDLSTTESESGGSSRCPAHDNDPSLSASGEKDSTTPLLCHAEGEAEASVKPLGLATTDLFATVKDAVESVRKSISGSCQQEYNAVDGYSYRDATDKVTLAIVLYAPVGGGDKTERTFYEEGAWWRIGDPQGPLLIYNLPEVNASTGSIYVVTSEKSADVANKIGLVCTTSAHGPRSASKSDWSPLAGRDVVIMPSNDELGEKYAMDVTGILTQLTPPARVRIVKLPDITEPGADVADYLALHANKSIDDQRSLIEELASVTSEWVDDAPRVEILDAAPQTIRRPLCIVNKRAYLATWVHIDLTGGENAVKRIVLRDDGVMFADTVVPNALPLAELGIDVCLQHEPHSESVMSGKALKRYVSGERVSPAEVFGRVRTVVEHFMDFSHSVGTQSDLVDFIALYVVAGYLLDAFSVTGYLWPNGGKGSGKTKLLQVITNLAYMGVLVTSSGSFATLRDLADYGATIGFDDAEIIAEKHGGSDKRELLLAGNNRAAHVTLKERKSDGTWKTRFVNTFCPRMFSAISLPDETLASRTIIVPLVRSADRSKATRDPADYEMWPVERRQLVDDLWALGLENLVKVKPYGREVVELTSLTGRVLDPWRSVLAVALWLQRDHGVTGLFGRIRDMAVAYQSERTEIEVASPVFILATAMQRLLDSSRTTHILVSPQILAEEANLVAREENIEYFGPEFTSAMKVGRLCQSLRIPYAPRTAGGKRLEVTQAAVNALAATHGYDIVKRNAPCVGNVDCVPLQETPPLQDGGAISSDSTSGSEVTAQDATVPELLPMMQEVGVA